MSKLVALNSLVILLVILLAGLSVKDYACFLVNSEEVQGQALVDTLNGFLWKASIVAFVIAGLFHYFTVKNIIGPIKHLSRAANEIKEGKTPSSFRVSASGELQELVDNFNAMSETLHTVQDQRESMLRDIAHELRTPLTNINGYLEALQYGVIKGDSELFGSLLEESRRITRIVELISEMNAWNNGVFLEKPFEKVEMKRALTESLTAFHLKLQEQFANVDVSLEEAYLLGNQDGLMQVFANILQNILDYNTGETLRIRGMKQSSSYIISFTHFGQFIDPDKRELIFERFYRGEASRSTKSSGAGLGLAISKSIIQAHKGDVGLDTDGNNHTFWISLPLTYGKGR
ncbi:MAG TPA: HAMP domain-containing sensor histidine kinase [Bacillaceae bacterium]